MPRAFPTISQYMDTMAEPDGLFRTAGSVIALRDRYGKPQAHAGGNAVVFKVIADDKLCGLKLFLKPNRTARHTVACLSEMRCTLLPEMRYMPEEVYVYGSSGKGAYHDTVITEWWEGPTLDHEIRKALHYGDGERFAQLAALFDRAALTLLDQPWAHGDLKPENMIVTAEGLRLIDFDAVWHPAIADREAVETGTPQYQHPLRDANLFCKGIDDYSIALISATLHTLSIDPALSGCFGNRDFYLLDPAAIFAGKTEPLEHCRSIAARQGRIGLYALLRMLESDTPLLPRLKDTLLYLTSARAAVGSLYVFTDGQLWGYCNAEGETVIPPLFESALEYSEGLAGVSLGGFSHFIDQSGEIAVDCSEYEAVKSFHDGLAAVRRDGLWGYIDRSGEEIIAPAYLKTESFRSGVARALTATGETLLRIENFNK